MTWNMDGTYPTGLLSIIYTYTDVCLHGWVCSGIKCSCIVSEHIIGSVCDNYRINVRPGMINYTSHGVANLWTEKGSWTGYIRLNYVLKLRKAAWSSLSVSFDRHLLQIYGIRIDLISLLY